MCVAVSRQVVPVRLVCLSTSATMSQDDVRSLWLDEQHGRLSAWEQAKALGLREASREIHDGKSQLEWVAARVTKVGGGHPSAAALHQFFSKVDADKDWYPGKHSGVKRGPTPLLTAAKRRCIAMSAMAAKAERGKEPCVAALIHTCPRATRNPATGKPFDAKVIRKVLTEDCYDFTPDHPWKFQLALQKVFLPESIKAHRLSMCSFLLEHGPAASWWPQHVVWFDPCASIIPGSQNQYDQMRQACKGRRRYISDDAKLYSPNLSGSATALKQRGWAGRKVSWVMVLARGTVHVEVMPDDWTVNGDGLAMFVHRLPDILRKMLGPDARLPKTIFTDRGTGMYTSNGRAVRAYSAAVKAAGLKLFWGEDATQQSPDMPDLLLHETAVAWFRKRMTQTPPACLPWEETQAEWTARARKAVSFLNSNYRADRLCQQFPQRLRACKDTDGERLRK